MLGEMILPHGALGGWGMGWEMQAKHKNASPSDSMDVDEVSNFLQWAKYAFSNKEEFGCKRGSL